ncbi:unnamed protein product [Dracunculus medinensis]|uniref:UAP56-interacting factor n=1 Tax=Dracunculus medinensis TaxID=318479 RepID=A0A158Q3I7_DRAME|nr:unnamed protein product [Dracunculus medinensis]
MTRLDGPTTKILINIWRFIDSHLLFRLWRREAGGRFSGGGVEWLSFTDLRFSFFLHLSCKNCLKTCVMFRYLCILCFLFQRFRGMDEKINMSLDEIIKKEKKFVGKKFLGKRRSLKRPRVTNNFGLKRRARKSSLANISNQNADKTGSATLRLVNRLVKNAIRSQANQTLISRAAQLQRRRIAVRRMAKRPAGGRRRFMARSSLPADRLRGVSQRSRIIFGRNVKGSGAASVRRLSGFRSDSVLRGRGTRLGHLVSDVSPVLNKIKYVPVDTVVKNQLPIQQRFTQRSVWNRIPQQQRVVIVDEVVLILFFVIFPFSNCICLFWFTWVQMTIWAERLIRPHGSIRTPPVRRQKFRSRKPVFERLQRDNRFRGSNPDAERMRNAFGIGNSRKFGIDESANSFLDRLHEDKQRAPNRRFNQIYVM